jgi:hypothetical protein
MGHERKTGGVHTRIVWRDLRKRDGLEDLGVDGRIFKKWNVGAWTGQRQVAVSCECGDELPGFHKMRGIS